MAELSGAIPKYTQLNTATPTHARLYGQSTRHMHTAGLSVLHGRAQRHNTQLHTAKYTYACEAVRAKHSPHAHSRTQRTPWQSWWRNRLPEFCSHCIANELNQIVFWDYIKALTVLARPPIPFKINSRLGAQKGLAQRTHPVKIKGRFVHGTRQPFKGAAVVTNCVCVCVCVCVCARCKRASVNVCVRLCRCVYVSVYVW
jgi:hypothetical protein